MREFAIFILVLAIVNISSTSEVHQSAQKNEQILLNHDVMNKKLLPDVKHLLKENSDGNRQKFLHLLNSLEVDGYKFVNGKSQSCLI